MSDNLIYSGLNIQYTITDDDINKALNHINTVEIQLINLLAIDIIPIKLNYIDYLDSNIPVVKDYAILIQDYNKLKDYSDNERIISSPANIKEYIDKLYKSSNRSLSISIKFSDVISIIYVYNITIYFFFIYNIIYKYD